MMNLSMIVALDENYGIGADNKLLWHLPDDFKWFKRHTIGKPVIMGRKTMESLPFVLPNRRNIVLSRDENKILEGFEHASSQEDALNKVHVESKDEVFIIGGSAIYELFLPSANKLYLTRVHTCIDKADAFFPRIERENWNVTYREHHPKDEKHKFAFDFEILERII